MSIQLRLVSPQGVPTTPLPHKKNTQYLDDDDDIGTLQFDYLVGGAHEDLLDEDKYTELAVFVDGIELPNSRFTVSKRTGNRVVDGRKYNTWLAESWMERLDEALILPEHDQHTREDVLTPAERRELQEAREEWMAQAIKEAIEEAKYKAKEHNDKVRDHRNKDELGAVTSGDDPDLEPLGKWGRKAIKWALKQIDNPSQDWYRMCQSFVRQSFGLPGIYGTANEAWFAGRKRTNTTIDGIPPGVPVYWGPNHVALSIGDGDCISTDVLRSGQVDIVPIASLHNGVHWSLDFRGWSPDCSGVAIYP